MPKISKELKTEVQENNLIKQSTELSKSSKDEVQMAEKQNSTTSLAIRGIEIKTTLIFYLTPFRMAKIIKQVTARTGKAARKEEHSSIAAGESGNWYSHYANHCGSSGS